MIKIEQNFNAPLEKILEVQYHRFTNLDDFPVLQNLKTLKTDQNGSELIVHRHVNLGSDLPFLLRAAIPKNYLVLFEELFFDTQKGIEVFAMYPEEKRERFSISGEIKYQALNANGAKRNIHFEVKTEVPVLTPLKGLIENMYAQGLADDCQDIIRLLN